MDDVYLYLAGGVVIAVFIIILNYKKQKSKVTSFLKDAGDVQPVFMQQAVEKKLKKLKTALYNNNPVIQSPMPVTGESAGETAAVKNQLLIAQLDQLERSYANGNIALKAYDDQLHRLIMMLPA